MPLFAGFTNAETNWPAFCVKNTDLVGRDAAVLCNGATSKYPPNCYYDTNLVGMDAAIACTESGDKWKEYWKK